MEERKAALAIEADNNYAAYLEGGGEMGELIRNYDWSITSIGLPHEWPVSLLNTLGTILHSKFPMFLFWGPDHLCFYNDAYRTSLGTNGKHPYALGQKGVEVWPEIWNDIKPLIDSVLSENEGTWSEDQLLPIYRNGKLEDVYWTFSYSPVIGEAGKPIGVFVTCAETTAKVQNAARLRESEQRFRNLIKNATVGIIVLTGSDMVVAIVNEMYCRIIHKSYHEVIGKPIFDVIPEAEAYYRQIIEQVRVTGEPIYLYDNPYFVFDNGVKREGFINVVYQPYKEEGGGITGVMILVHDVTEQVVARQKDEQSREELRLALEIGKLGTFTIDLSNNHCTYSQRLRNWFNLAGNSQPIDLIVSKVHPDDFEKVKKAITAAQGDELTGGHDIIYRVVNPENGQLRHLHSVGEVQYTNGMATSIIGVVQDVTAEVLAKKNLEESEQKLRSLVESAPFPIGVYVGEEMRIELANQAILAIWGKGHDVIGRPYKELLPELRYQNIFEQYDRVLLTGNSFQAHNKELHVEVQGKVKTYYFNYSYTPLRNTDGTVYGVMSTAADVTDLNIAKQKVEESEERFRTMAEGSQVLIAQSDETSNATYFNKAWSDFTGRPVQHLLEYGWVDLIHPDDRDKLVNIYLTGFKKRESWTGEFRMLNKDGQYRWIITKGVVRSTSDAPFAGYISSSIDITEQKQFAEALEEKVAERTRELAEANLKLQRTNTELNQFAYIASHDLQEPLRKVRTFTDLMEKSLGVIPDRANNYISKIKHSAERMQNLINDVLKFSLLSREEEKVTKVNMNDIVHGILSDLELLIEQKEAKIQISELPVIHAISIHMRQLINNLITNSLKFTIPGKPIEISISSFALLPEDVSKYEELDSNKLHYQFEVRDNGIGFNQENAEQIFTMFQRLHGKAEYEGTGIGLAMCKKIVQNHHGLIYATSAPGDGATFIFILPE